MSNIMEVFQYIKIEYIALCSCLYVLFHYLFLMAGFRTTKKRLLLLNAICSLMISIFIFTFMNIMNTNYIFAIMLVNTFIGLMVVISFKGKMYTRLSLAVLVSILISIYSIIWNYLALFIMPITFFESKIYASLSLVLSVIVLFIIIKIIENEFKSIKNHEFIGLESISWLVSMVNSLLILVIYLVDKSYGMFWLSLIIIITVVILTNYLLLSIILKIGFDQYELQQIKRNLNFETMKFEYINLMQQQNEETRRIRHDMKASYRVLYALIEKEENDEAKTYIQQLVEEQNSISIKIQSGNEVIDVLTNYYIMKHPEIKFTFNCLVNSDSWIKNLKLCQLYGNAIENAVEGCLASDIVEKEIDIFITSQEDMLVLQIGNTSPPVQEPFTSTKRSEEHGYGLKSIRKVVEEYRGYLDINCKNNWFTLRAILSIEVK